MGVRRHCVAGLSSNLSQLFFASTGVYYCDVLQGVGVHRQSSYAAPSVLRVAESRSWYCRRLCCATIQHSHYPALQHQILSRRGA